MGALEQISQMKSQGLQESEIISQLKEKGVSPKEINDALSQSQVKDAVYNPREETLQPAPAPAPEEQTEAAYVPQTQEEQEAYSPQQQQQPQQTYAPSPQEEYAPPQEVYPQENYDYAAQESYTTDTIIDVAEQVFAEKIKKIERALDQLKDTQVILQTQVEHATERLRRSESIMDKLQIEILRKVGSYGTNLESIKKEMGMIEDSFSKIIPHRKHPAKKTHHKTPLKKTSKKR